MAQYVKVGTHYDFGLQELGEAILRDAFRCASKVFLQAMTPTYEANAIAQSVAFVQGSGVETIIQMFSLNLNPDHLRSTFQWKLHQIQASVSSSAITQGV